MDVTENDFDFRVKILSRIIEDQLFFENLKVYKLCNELWAKCENVYLEDIFLIEIKEDLFKSPLKLINLIIIITKH